MSISRAKGLKEEIIAATQDEWFSTDYFKRNILKDVTSESPLWKRYEENIDYPTSGRRVLEENKNIMRCKKRSTLIWLNARDRGIETAENW